MMYSGNLLYRVLGTGCFFALFWLGYVVAYQLGLHTVSSIVLGLVSGSAGVYLVVRLESSDPGPDG